MGKAGEALLSPIFNRVRSGRQQFRFSGIKTEQGSGSASHAKTAHETNGSGTGTTGVQWMGANSQRRLVMGKNGRRFTVGLAMTLFWATLSAVPAFSHCEIPCGIYGDEMRFAMMKEDIATIEKSMNQVIELSKEAKPNYNQIVRWVQNKEHHADKIRDVVTQYFLAQRVKPVLPKGSAEHDAYVNQLTLLHDMIVTSMKCKQTTELSHVEKLKQLVDSFSKAYLGN